MPATEYVILVDENDTVLGQAPKLYAHEHALLHRAFSVFIYRKVDGTSKIEWLLQQRALQKYHSPGLWTNTCCSHPKPDEAVLEAALRRLSEEMGLSTALKHCGQFHYQAAFANGLTEHEIDHVFIGEVTNPCDIKANAAEVASFRWIETNSLRQELENNPDSFTPWFKAAWDIALL